jgi:glycosyltransferase involved in cell wall biosynthesis
LRCAVVHDWLTGQRGGEHVLEAVLDLLPGADLHCVTHVKGAVSPALEQRAPRTSWLARIPGLRGRPAFALPLLTRAVESLDLRAYDAVLSVSHCVAVGARVRGAHLVYSLSPMRYAWDGYEDYASEAGGLGPVLGPVARVAGARLRDRLRRWDARAGRRARAIAAISEHVRARVRSAYGRDARLVYPPVDTEALGRAGRAATPGERFIAVSALRPNKRLALVALAFRKLGLPLDIVGQGSPRAIARLRELGGPTVQVLGEVSRGELVDRVARSRALVHAANEDFGIAPVEALAAGRPVIAFGACGVRESVAPTGEAPAGVLFFEATAEAVEGAVRLFLEGPSFDPESLRARAERFSLARFRESFARFLREEGGGAFPVVAGTAVPVTTW